MFCTTSRVHSKRVSLVGESSSLSHNASKQVFSLIRFKEISDDCHERKPERPGDNCRFFPSSSNSVNSSITFLPWANGVTQFCDEHTHNHDAPNRQNLFCGHRSIWEVIRESEDFWSLTEDPEDSAKVPQFRILRVSTRPLFYLLLDRGRTSVSLQRTTQHISHVLKRWQVYLCLRYRSY